MSGRDDGPIELDLAGYVALSEHGFALPCFANGPNPNTWYTSVCSVSGDHLGTISAFERFVSDEIRPVSPELIRRKRVGDRWCDVFLWDGQHYVGEPDELWAALKDACHRIAAHAPITLLDLGACVSTADGAALARDAFKYVHDRFGDAKAKIWRRDVFIRQRIILHLQRLVQGGRITARPEAVRAIEITDDDGRLSMDVPQALRDQLTSTGAMPDLSGELRSLAETFSMTASMPGDANTELDLEELDASSETTEQASADGRDLPRASEDSGNVLVIIIGPRAEQIARHLSSPEWIPTWHEHEASRRAYGVTHFPRGRIPNDERGGPPDIHVVHKGSQLPPLDHYDVLVAIVDDDLLADGTFSSSLPEMLDRHSVEKGHVRLLVPALPRNEPSRSISTQIPWVGPNRGAFDMLLDTATARSPFWFGSPRRALDRRIADIVIGAALLCTGRSPLSEFLQSRYAERNQLLLTFALEAQRRLADQRFELSSSDLGVSSESNWIENRSRRRDGIPLLFKFGANWRDKRLGGPIAGTAVICEASPDFERFGLTILRDTGIVRDEHTRTSVRLQQVPAEVRKCLQFPQHVCGASVSVNGRTLQLSLTAETPSVDAVKAAAKEGWAIFRYTDHEAIREVMTESTAQHRVVIPHEIRLPRVRRLPQNRRLVTRGIDPRDVVRLAEPQLKELKLREPAELLKAVRRYRASIGGEAKREAATFVLPLVELEEAQSGNRSAKHLVRRLEPHRLALDRPPRRPADLRAAWMSPPDGCTRFAIADGAIPVILTPLAQDEVPAQRLFIINGDAAVPALLQSRVFEVWAQATLSRSSSWMSRFSVSGTFETFPIVRPFELIRHSEQSVSLMLRRGDRALYSLAQEWLRYLDREHISTKAIDAKGHERLRLNPMRARLNEVILDAYGLPPDASDLAILERLLVTNARS